HSAALMPFKLRSIYGTHAFERNLMSPDGEVQGQLNLDERSLKSFRLLNAYALALYRLYGIESHVDYPLIFTTRDAETGLDRHFKIYFDGSFLDVEPLRPFPPLAEEVRQRLDAHAVDADGLAALIPPGSVRIAPLHYQREPIGTLSLTSPNPGDINSLLAPRLQEVLPLFSMAVKRSVDELHSRIQAFIKEKATAIHPVVEWRFRQAVLES